MARHYLGDGRAFARDNAGGREPGDTTPDRRVQLTFASAFVILLIMVRWPITAWGCPAKAVAGGAQLPGIH